MDHFTFVDIKELEDTYNLAFYDFVGKGGSQDLAEFNEALLDGDAEDGAQWVEQREFRTIYNYLRRFNRTYNYVACEMRFTVDLLLGDFDENEYEDVLRNFGLILHDSLRRSDIIMQNESSFYLLLPDLSEQDKLAVINRIRRNLKREGLYQVLLMRVDTMMIGPDREYETWYQVAV